MTIEWIRKRYRVPAKRGGRIEYTGRGAPEYGTITGARGGHLKIRMDGWANPLPFHPTWEIKYLEKNHE